MLPAEFVQSSPNDALEPNSSNETPVETAGLNGVERTNTNDLAPQEDSDLLPVVGLGASAGGVGALQQFFSRIPTDTGMAFVVVLHLSPLYESSLPQILQAKTLMPVVQVREAVTVEANHIYVIPPSHHLIMRDGQLHLAEPQQARGTRVAVDLFFRSLVASQRSKGVAVVLSGTDGDGAVGIKRVKEQGGVTIAQDPDEAEHDGMPRSAIETGMVDWVLPVLEIADKLVEWVRNEDRIHLPTPEAVEKQVAGAKPSEDEDAVALREVLAFLHARTGHDFSHYKSATVLRRILRRLQVNSLESLPAYVAFLRTHPGEAGALLQDLLISVTNFFRDPESFIALDTFLPKLFQGKTSADSVRVWVPGCATGEEAYSLAMLLLEHAETLESPPQVQIFATDLDEQALRFAREGSYPGAITADVSPERLRRFFVPDARRHRVKKDVRERVLFAGHNILRDPPFSRLDLVSCRNLLIYFNRTAQDKVLDLFHFALRPGALLFLGASETADDQPLFLVRDKTHRVYERQLVARALSPLPVVTGGPLAPHVAPLPRARSAKFETPPMPEMPQEGASLGELHLKLLEQVAPPSVLVDANYDVVHLSQRAGSFLQFTGGEVSLNLLRIVPPALRLDLQSALFRAFLKGEDVDVAPVAVGQNGAQRIIGARVRAMHSDDATQSPAPGSFALVIFDEDGPDDRAILPARPAPLAGGNGGASDSTAHRLDEELQYLRAFLATSVEQYEASSEELRASNEELQAMNEEHRSAREELETSREEIQAANEELSTLNQELRSKIEEVSRAHSDLQNLMASTGLATVFLTRDLRIKRYTPRATEVFRLIPSDIGRPIADLRHRFADESFIGDAQQVLDSLGSVEREIQTLDGTSLLERVLPYRTLDDKIDGVVLTFLDITDRKMAERALSESEREWELITQNAPISILYLDREDHVRFANRQVLGWLGKTMEQVQDKPLADLLGEGYHGQIKPNLERVWHGEAVEYEARLAFPAAGERDVSVRCTPEVGRDGHVRGVVAIIADVSVQKQAERVLREAQRRLGEFESKEELRTSQERLSIAVEAAGFGTWDWDLKTDRVYWNEQHFRLFGMEPSDKPLYSRAFIAHVHPDDSARVSAQLREAVESKGVFEAQFRVVREDGEVRWISGYGRVVAQVDGRATRMSGVMFDATESQNALAAVRQSEERLRLLVESAKDYAIYTTDLERRVNSWNAGAQATFGWSEEEILGQSSDLVFTPEDREAGAPEQEAQTALIKGSVADERWHLRRDGSRFYASGVMRKLGEGEPRGFVKIARDLTERQQNEEALRQSEERFRGLISKGADMITVSNRQGRITYASPTTERVSGYTPDEFRTLNPFDTMHPDDRPRCEEALRELARTPDLSLHLQHRIRHKDGSWRWVEGTFTSLFHDPAIGGLVANVRDITANKEAEDALRGSEARFRAIINQATAGIALVDLDGRFLEINSQLCEMTGLSSEQVMRMRLQELICRGASSDELREFDEKLRASSPFYVERRTLRGDGTPMWINAAIAEVRDGEEPPQSAVAVIVDITQRREAEIAQRESEEQRRIAVEGAGLGTCDWHYTDNVMHWNDQHFALFGMTPRPTLRVEDFYACVHPHDLAATREALRAGIEDAGQYEIEFRIIRQNDRAIRWINDSGRVVARDANGFSTRVGHVVMDTTERREAEEVLKQSHDELEERVRERTIELARTLEQLRRQVEQRRQAELGRDQLLRRIVNTQEEERRRISRELHDNLGQHLTAVMLGLEALETQMAPFTGGKRKNQTLPQLDTLRTLVDGLMQAAHRQAWELRPAELDDMGLEVALRHYASDWSVQTGVEVDFQAVGWEEGRADPAVETTLYRVVQEALTNVARHANASQVSVVLERNAGGVSAIIEDDGAGFETDAGESGRLGLLGMSERLALVNGTLDIESAPDSGTTVFARVPAGGRESGS